MLVKINAKGWPERVITNAVSVPRVGEHVLIAPGVPGKVSNVTWALPSAGANGEVEVLVDVAL